MPVKAFICRAVPRLAFFMKVNMKSTRTAINKYYHNSCQVNAFDAVKS